MEDGGNLRIWYPRTSSSSSSPSSLPLKKKVKKVRYVDISPVGGRLVLFLSSCIYHQVLPIHKKTCALKEEETVKKKERIAISAWVHGDHDLDLGTDHYGSQKSGRRK